MTLPEFSEMLLTADPNATRYKSDQKPNYTTWIDFGRKKLMANNRVAERAHKVQIDRFTKIEDDPIAEAITAVLDENEIAYEYLCDFEQDTGYIHHIWDCEVD